MSCILHIETSTQVCSVAVSDDSQVIYHEEERTSQKGSAAERLGSMVDEAVSFADSHAIPFDAVAVSCGPGSYTGLRIGVSMAKGLCYGRDLQLVAVPTLELLCVPVLLSEKVRATNSLELRAESVEFATAPEAPEGAPDAVANSTLYTLHSQLPDDALLCPMLDARRMEVYAGLYDRALRPVRPVQADVVQADTYRTWLDERPVFFFGNGAEKCMATIAHPNAYYIDGIEPLARWMQPLAERRLLAAQTESVAYFEPFYLKDYVAKMPRSLL